MPAFFALIKEKIKFKLCYNLFLTRSLIEIFNTSNSFCKTTSSIIKLRIMKKSIIQISLFLSCLFFVNVNFAVTTLPNAKSVLIEKTVFENAPISSIDFEKKTLKKGNFAKRFLQKRLLKRITKKVNKASKKAQRDGLLADSRIYLGLILLLAGIVIGLLLANWLAWIGWLSTTAGLILIIWGLLANL